MNSLFNTTSFTKAKIMYLDGSYSAEQIAIYCKISSKSVRRWIKKYNWKQLRNNYSILFSDVLSNLLQQIIDINLKALRDGSINNEQTASLKQLIEAYSLFKNEVSKLSMLIAFNQFDTFLQKKFIEHYDLFQDIKAAFWADFNNNIDDIVIEDCKTIIFAKESVFNTSSIRNPV